MSYTACDVLYSEIPECTPYGPYEPVEAYLGKVLSK
jgi:hypothetical protein